MALMSFLAIAIGCIGIFSFYTDIEDELRQYHSKTYIKKNRKGFRNFWLFESFKGEINKLRYVLLLIGYLLFLVSAFSFVFSFIVPAELIVGVFFAELIYFLLSLVKHAVDSVAEFFENINVIKMIFVILGALILIAGTITFIIEFLT